MKTIAVLADRLLWEYGLPSAPGDLKPGARDLMAALCSLGSVVVVSTHLNTLVGHRRVLDLLLTNDIPYTDLWLAPGFPEHDEVVAHVATCDRGGGEAE